MGSGAEDRGHAKEEEGLTGLSPRAYAIFPRPPSGGEVKVRGVGLIVVLRLQGIKMVR